MKNTLNEFKKEQNKEMEILSKLRKFLDVGEGLGVDIDISLKEKLNNAIDEVGTNKLKVALVGGFSEGKTSIAAAWMEKLDKSNMKITHQESSDEVLVYDVDGDIQIVDTPGLYGFKEKNNQENSSVEKYKDITKKYVSEAHIVLYIMNSVNPLKESHKDDMNWLFRSLNLLPRTIFVLSKFDDIADIGDNESYDTEFAIKKENVLERLDSLIELNEQELSNISIVAVSANPFDMGMEHWLDNIDKFKKLSRISNLQSATTNLIKHNGGASSIVQETKNTIIRDVLQKQLPIVIEENNKINQEVYSLKELNVETQNSLMPVTDEIKNARIALRSFVVDYITDLILQVKGTNLETFLTFYEKEIGENNLNLNTKIQNEFESVIGSISLELQKIENNFDGEINIFKQNVKSYGKQGLQYLSKSGIINPKNIKAGRDLLSSTAKAIGFDISKYLNFKPYGAIKFAKGAGAAVAVLSFGIEAWDSWDKYKKEQEVQKAILDTEKGLNDMKNELINHINSEEFEQEYFPNYIRLKEKIEQIKQDIINREKTQQSFNEWAQMGDIIDVEFEDTKLLSQSN